MGWMKLIEATVKSVTVLPVAVVKDVLTCGGSVLDEPQPFTKTALEDIADDIDEIAD